MHAFMAAPLADQAEQLRDWGESPAGLLILMSACEGQCFFCAQPVVTNPPSSLITRWEDIAGKLESNRSLGLTHLMVGGTEPPTHVDFERALGKARACGFETVQLMTSALTLPDRGQVWWSLGVRSVCTPIYSADADTHDAIVGVGGHWQRVVAGLDTAAALGMTVYPHTLAMRRTLTELPSLAHWVRTRWGASLAVAPLRPKDSLFSFAEEAVRLHALRAIHTDAMALVGFPSCVGAPGQAALLTRLYFRSQRRAFAAPCEDCSLNDRCEGVVLGHLDHFGSEDLIPRSGQPSVS